ncbi:MAG: pseudouridine-5'-phosphate glycosidase [Granulosicoccaceae bacterium]
MNTQAILLSKNVANALQTGKPVVALESTIITHGMPYPANRDTALEVESLIEAQGVVPATIAVLAGKLIVGLSHEEIDSLAQQQDVMKLSSADLPFAISAKRNGSTTVAATMIAAKLADIDVFATGGIGGVHRGAELSFDISADLTELGRTNVTVVCAGAKAILDLSLTLEVLETLGVPVVAYGQDALPAFWSRDSGIKAPLRLDAAFEIASFIEARNSLDMTGGLLIANPVEAEHEIPSNEMRGYIEQALNEAQAQQVYAKAVTPWLLQRIMELTDGKSLTCNQALVKNNARLACEISTALATHRRQA